MTTDLPSPTKQTTRTTTRPNRDLSPYVRYGYPAEAEEPTQLPTLHHISESVPDGATTVSPVYMLTSQEVSRLQSLENPYRVCDANNIAIKLQNEAESDNRVFYPVLIESDNFGKMAGSEIIQLMNEFVTRKLGCEPHETTFYYSGNRSIHCHLSRFVHGEKKIRRLKQLAEEFCDATRADFDTAIYSRKRQFRLPGVEHSETGMAKVQVAPDWTREQIVRQANLTDKNRPSSARDLFEGIFSKGRNVERRSTIVRHHLPDFVTDLGARSAILSLNDASETYVPLVERDDHPDHPADIKVWAQYNYQPFSPYANADDGSRSVAVIEVKRGAFARKDITVGERDQPAHALIPAYFYGARGCSGEFTKNDEHAPLQLSQQDYSKWEYGKGDLLAIIGGRSRNSRILELDEGTAKIAGYLLGRSGDSRGTVLYYLDSRGYKIGEAGSGSTEVEGTGESAVIGRQDDSMTEAQELKQKAEGGHIDEDLTHEERWRVACSLLKRGWEEAWNWFRDQYGSEFDPDVTRRQLRSIIKSYPEDYSHVEIP